MSPFLEISGITEPRSLQWLNSYSQLFCKEYQSKTRIHMFLYVCMYVSIYLSVCLSVDQSIYLPVSVYLSFS